MDEQAKQTIRLLREQVALLDATTQAIVDGTSDLSEGQKTAFFKALSKSHDNLVVALTNALKKDDAAWVQVGLVVEATQKSLKHALENITNLSSNINKITNAVSTVTQVLSIIA